MYRRFHWDISTNFSPTDVFLIPPGQPVIQSVVKQGLLNALKDSQYREAFLCFNQLNDVIDRFEEERVVFGHHPLLLNEFGNDLVKIAHRVRSLSLYRHFFFRLGIESYLKDIKSMVSPSILHLGCGNGRILLELAKLFPRARIYGIGRQKGEEGFLGIESLSSLNQILGCGEVLDRIEIDFLDLDQRIDFFPDINFDLIISRNSFRYLRDPTVILNALPDRLREKGAAFIDLQLVTFLHSSTEKVFLKEYDALSQSLRLTPESSLEFFLEKSSPSQDGHGWSTELSVSRSITSG